MSEDIIDPDHGKVATRSEETIIAIALADNSTIPIIATQVKPEFFYSRKCARFWRIIEKVYNSEDVVDQVMVGNVIMSAKKKAERNDVVELARIASDAWSPSVTVDTHIKTVRALWHKREYVYNLVAHLDRSKEGPEPVEKIRDSFDSRMNELSMALDIGSDTHIGSDLSTAAEKWGHHRGIPTGLMMLDEITCGFMGGDYHVYAARASMGKTFLMCHFIREVCIAEKQPALCFSLEMSRYRMQTRLIGYNANISPKRIFMWDEIQPNEDMRIKKSHSTLNKTPLFLDDQAGVSIEQIRYRTRRHIQEYGVKVVFVDYLQLCTTEADNVGTREQEVARVAEGMKAIAKDLDVCVVSLSQLSRETDRRQGHRPRLSDLRESGAIEQAADIIGFLHRPEYYGSEFIDDGEGGTRSVVGRAFVYVDKNRNGETGEVECGWDDQIAQFNNDGG